MAWIYVLKNKINGKRYVGQTTQKIKDRFEEYRYPCKNSNRYIIKAIKKHGWNNFKKFYFWCPEFLLDFFESFYIFILNTTNKNYGYNLESGGHKFKHLNEVVKNKISNSNKGKKAWNKGIPFSEETKKKMTASKQGKHCGKNNPNYGRKASEETRRKQSEAKKGKDPWNKNKKGLQKAWNKNKKYSKEQKSKLNLFGLVKGYEFCKKKVICIETGEIFNSIKDASDVYNISSSCISECCKGKQNTADNKHWFYYIEGMEIPSLEKLEQESFYKKIICIETLEIFLHIKWAADKYGISLKNISECCKGKRKTCGGYHWMYYSDYLKNKEVA